MQQNLTDQISRLVSTNEAWRTWRGSGTDDNFEKLEEWVANIEEVVKNTLNETKVFMKVRELMHLTEHKAGENMVTDPAWFEIRFQMVEELAELTLHPDDVSEIFMSAEESDLCFKEPDDHLGRTG